MGAILTLSRVTETRRNAVSPMVNRCLTPITCRRPFVQITAAVGVTFGVETGAAGGDADVSAGGADGVDASACGAVAPVSGANGSLAGWRLIQRAVRRAAGVDAGAEAGAAVAGAAAGATGY